MTTRQSTRKGCPDLRENRPGHLLAIVLHGSRSTGGSDDGGALALRNAWGGVVVPSDDDLFRTVPELCGVALHCRDRSHDLEPSRGARVEAGEVVDDHGGPEVRFDHPAAHRVDDVEAPGHDVVAFDSERDRDRDNIGHFGRRRSGEANRLRLRHHRHRNEGAGKP